MKWTIEEFNEILDLAQRMRNSREDIMRSLERAKFPPHVVASWPLCDQDAYFKNIAKIEEALLVRDFLAVLDEAWETRH